MNQFARPGLGVTELPPVNADDNGKVLGVSDGAWEKVAASGGSDLPDDPAQDGTYNLQNTVSSGTGTLSWASGSSGGGVLVVHEDENGTLDKTWQEIYDSDLCILNYGAKMIQYGAVEPIGQGKFKVFFWDFYESSRVVYEADTPTSYPVYVEDA